MLLKRKNKIDDIIFIHYSAMLKVAKSLSITNNPEFELLPAIFVLTDIAAIRSGKNRQKVADISIKKMKKIYPKLDTALLDKRTALYGEIIRGKPFRAEWFMGDDNSPLNANVVAKCTAVLGDILYNPDCASDYDKAPVVIYDIFESMMFSNSVMKTIYDELGDLYIEIYELKK